MVNGKAGDVCTKPALSLMAGPKLSSPSKPNTMYRLSDMYLMLLAIYAREEG